MHCFVIPEECLEYLEKWRGLLCKKEGLKGMRDGRLDRATGEASNGFRSWFDRAALR